MAASLSLYRKYRPKTFGEIVGQEHVVTTLRNALRLNRLSHAYLFAGPRGTGKTTVARLLARYLSCTEGEPFVEVCPQENLCANCAAILKGNHPDLFELDAASNRGIDEVRQLRENARVAPIQSSFKMYILDEVHMLTKDAANALLKTLEEPPPHVIFVLATTNPERLPLTVISRCQRFDFRPLTVSEIAQRLASLAEAESATLSDDALELLAEAADGSLRDGESLLEQVLTFFAKEATREDILRLLGIPDPSMLHDLAGAIFSSNSAHALEALNVLIGRGTDATSLAIRLTSYLRDVLLLSADRSLAPLIERRMGPTYVARALEHAASVPRKKLMAILPKFLDAVEETKRSPIPQLPLELAIVEATDETNEETMRS
jgi:DNA polymerase-3 subunit gamma/tau